MQITQSTIKRHSASADRREGGNLAKNDHGPLRDSRLRGDDGVILIARFALLSSVQFALAFRLVEAERIELGMLV